MKRPFDPSVDVHIDFLRHHVRGGIASGAARLLIEAQEALLNAHKQVTAIKKSAQIPAPAGDAPLEPIAMEGTRTLDGVEREAAGYLVRLSQLEKLQSAETRTEIRELRLAHGAVEYVLREKRSELQKLVPAPETARDGGVLHAA